MRFSAPLIPATLVTRYKRFLADVTLASGETITVHCANPGSMIGLNAAGAPVWLSKSVNANRKLAHSWELIEVDLGVDSSLSASTRRIPMRLRRKRLRRARSRSSADTQQFAAR